MRNADRFLPATGIPEPARRAETQRRHGFLKPQDVPPGTDLGQLARIEHSIRRRGGRTRWLSDPATAVLDALYHRTLDKMASLDAIDETDDQTLSVIPGVAEPRKGALRFDSPYGLRFRHGPWRKVALRAFALLDRLSTVRVAQRRGGFTREAMEQTARLLGEYHVWKHTPRLERSADWPRSRDAFAEGYGITIPQLDQALHLVRYRRWEGRYLEKESPEVVRQRTLDVLNEAIARQSEVAPEKVNANLVRMSLMAQNIIRSGGVTVNTGPRVEIRLTAEQSAERRRRLAEEARRLERREIPDATEVDELPATPSPLPPLDHRTLADLGQPPEE
jgi:hypothetical protein